MLKKVSCFVLAVNFFMFGNHSIILDCQLYGNFKKISAQST